jgi:hypothetical protein
MARRASEPAYILDARWAVRVHPLGSLSQTYPSQSGASFHLGADPGSTIDTGPFSQGAGEGYARYRHNHC